MTAAAANGASPVAIANQDGASPFLFACEHASNRLPPEFGTLGLAPGELERHIAWDPGALAVAAGLSRRLDAALVASTISRLVVDCNRPLDAPDLISQLSETTVIPGNNGLSADQRRRRINLAWRPFHDALGRVIEMRLREGRTTCLVTIHSFTPVWKGKARPWHVGIIHDDDERISASLLAGLRAGGDIVVGDNEPYAPSDRVYFTLEHQARPRGLPCAMIEIRNDLIAGAAGQQEWSERMSRLLAQAGADMLTPPRQAGQVRHA